MHNSGYIPKNECNGSDILLVSYNLINYIFMVIIHNKCVHQSELLDFASNNTDLGFIKSLRFTVKKKKKRSKTLDTYQTVQINCAHHSHVYMLYKFYIYVCVLYYYIKNNIYQLGKN